MNNLKSAEKRWGILLIVHHFPKTGLSNGDTHSCAQSLEGPVYMENVRIRRGWWKCPISACHFDIMHSVLAAGSMRCLCGGHVNGWSQPSIPLNERIPVRPSESILLH